VREDGKLGAATGFAQHSGSGADPVRQSSPHTHSVSPSPDQRFAIAADLGVDKLYIYHLDHGQLIPNDPPIVKAVPGAGPRHFTFHPSGRYGYLVNELNSTVAAFKYDDRRGLLEEIQVVSAVPKEFSGTNSSADMHVHPSGRFLYASDRGRNSIAVFSIDRASGRLSPIEYVPTLGKTPRNFAIDPTGSFLVAGNEDSNSIVVFRIDAKTGRLTPTGDQAFVPFPACIKFVPQK
jgi:6-phosphogluconolactonase